MFARLPLGWQVSLVASSVLALVMGISISLNEERHGRSLEELREDLLRKSLSPLALRLTAAETRSEVEEAITEFHEAYLLAGYGRHEILLEDAGGLPLWTGGASGGRPLASDVVRATLPLSSPALPTGSGRLVVWEDRRPLEGVLALRQRAVWGHIASSLVALVVIVPIVVQFLVARPLAQLRRDLERMERGYWGDVRVRGASPEIRWLARRFVHLGQELRQIVEQLVEAERRAFGSPSYLQESRPVRATAHIRGQRPRSAEGIDAEELHSVASVLESERGSEAERRALARVVWGSLRQGIESLDDWPLRTRLENAALRVLEPVPFRALEQRIEGLAGELEELLVERERELRSALDTHEVPVLEIQRRVKHAASVWRKMQDKHLRLDQVQDLIALRAIVPTEADCYSALKVVHTRWAPEYGRFNDYIARPKANGYRSLHTCVRAPDGLVFEVQIRSVSMHRTAETGTAAHWFYKSATSPSDDRPPRPWRRFFRRFTRPSGQTSTNRSTKETR